MRANHQSKKRLLNFELAKKIVQILCQSINNRIGYTGLQRKVEGSKYLSANNSAFDQSVILLERCNVLQNRRHRVDGKSMMVTEETQLGFKRYSNILRIPDMDIRNRRRRSDRVLIFLNILMLNHINLSQLPWNMLKGNFPYLSYPPRIRCTSVEHALGMPLPDFLCQRSFPSNGVVFPSNLSYSSDEIKNLSDMLERFNNNNNVEQTHNAVQIGEKVYSSSEDKLLCTYIERMGLYLLAQKYWEEYDLVSTLRTYDTLKQAFWNQEHFFRFIWYKSRFETKGFSTIVNKYGIARERLDNVYDEVFSQYQANVRELFKRTIRGEEYKDTRKKYRPFVNEMQDIVLPYAEVIKYTK